MTRANAAYHALVDAVEAETPPCRGDDRYIADSIPVPPELQLKCSTCLAFPECRTYALAARPKAGIWAGERWNTPRKPGRPRKDQP